MKIPQIFRIKGMNQQLSPNLFSSEYSFENKNIRIVSSEDNSTLSIVNEKGNVEVLDSEFNKLILGTPIGIINTPNCDDSNDDGIIYNGFVIFTTEDKDATSYDEQGNPVIVSEHIDRIYLIKDSDSNGSLESTLLYEGNLNFSTEHPIDGIYDSSAESKKIYWTDNYNEVRHMPINKLDFPLDNTYNTSFNTEIIDIDVDIKRIDSGGLFPSGVRQYIITAFQKYGPETSPLYISPLLYAAQKDRGLAPDENVTCSYNIKIDFPNVLNSEYWLCIYAIHRTTFGEEVKAYKVREIQLPKSNDDNISIQVLDTGLSNTAIDISELLYKDTQEIKCKTLSHKSNTLFLGNITVHNNLNIKDDDYYILSECEDTTDSEGNTQQVPIITLKNTLDVKESEWLDKKLDSLFGESTTHDVSIGKISDYYPYQNQLYNACRYLKRGEQYRLGLQFQDKYGKWSEPVFVSDIIPDGIITTTIDEQYNVTAHMPKFYLDLFEYVGYAGNENDQIPYKMKESNKKWINRYLELGYKKVRPVIVYPEIYQRRVLCQGMLQYTVSNVQDNMKNQPYCQSLWLARPTFNPNATDTGVSGHIFPTIQDINEGIYTVGHNTIADLPRQLIGTYGGIKNSAGGLPEIQTSYVGSSGYESTDSTVRESLAKESGIGTESMVKAHPELFFLQSNVITFHSPDIEISQDLHSAELQDYYLNVVGYHVVNNYYTNIDISTTTGPSLEKGAVPAQGFQRKVFEAKSGQFDTGTKNYWDGIYKYDDLIYHYYEDALREDDQDGGKFTCSRYPSIFLWQAGGSLSGDVITDNNPQPASMLASKKFLFASSSLRTIYTKNDSPFTQINDIQIFKADSDPLVLLATEDSHKKLYYYGSVDTIIPFNLGEGEWKDDINTAGGVLKYRNAKRYGYPVLGTQYSKQSGFVQILLANPDTFDRVESQPNELFYFHTIENLQDAEPDAFIGNNDSQYSQMPKLKLYTKLGLSYAEKDGGFKVAQFVNAFKKDPVLMKYKSTPHIVIALKEKCNMVQGKYWGAPASASNSPKFFVHPLRNNVTGQESGWSNTVSVNYGTSNGYGEHDLNIKNMILMAELWRKDVGENDSIFGGTTRQELQIHKWIPCGKSVSLEKLREEYCYIQGTSQGDFYRPTTYIVINDGDTYFQKYDCLKTFPNSTEDENSLVNIHSFMCETRINLDGRYDKNRGTDNLGTNPSIFNRHNPVYNQPNDFYQYSVSLEEKTEDYSHYPCQITWSKTKLPKSRIDTWTNITLNSVLNIDGEKGPISKIIRHNNDLVVFQDDGISKIIYNENAMVSTSNGFPIELANSGKVTGNSYISNSVGARNKDAIINAEGTLFFIDDYRKTFNSIQKDTPVSLDAMKIHPWFAMQDYYNEWDPIKFNTIRLQYDDINKEVLIITKNTCLAYNLYLNEFTSFYDYGDTPYFVNLNGYLYAIKQDGSIYKQYSGEYNSFFGQKKPFSIALIANGKDTQGMGHQDKLWDSFEFITDSYDADNDLLPSTAQPFNRIQASTGYQDTGDISASFKKKFNVWRAQIPRLPRLWNSQNTALRIKDRIRNPWVKLKFTNEGNNNTKTIIRDIIINSYL